MAIKTTEITYKYICPKCKKVIKTQTIGGFKPVIYFFLFIPFGLFALINFIITLITRKKNYLGDEVLYCSNCKKYIVAYTTGSQTYTRELLSINEIMEKILPALKTIHNSNISIGKINEKNEATLEKIGLQFKNSNNKEIIIIIVVAHNGNLHFYYNNEIINYTQEALVSSVLNSLQ